MLHDSNRLVRLTTVSSLTEADIIRAALGTSGIDAVISGEHTTQMFPHLCFGRGVPILVRQSDLQTAQEILQK